MGEIEKNYNFYKEVKKKNQNNKVQIEKHNTINLNWIEWWNWKLLKLLQKDRKKKLEI